MANDLLNGVCASVPLKAVHVCGGPLDAVPATGRHVLESTQRVATIHCKLLIIAQLASQIMVLATPCLFLIRPLLVPICDILAAIMLLKAPLLVMFAAPILLAGGPALLPILETCLTIIRFDPNFPGAPNMAATIRLLSL